MPSKRFASPVLGGNFLNHCSNIIGSHQYQSWYRFHNGYYVPCLINQQRNKLLPVGPNKFICDFWNLVLSLSLSLRRDWETSPLLSWHEGVSRHYWNEQLAATTRQETVSCRSTCMTYTIAVCTVKNSWWWTEELSETCRVLFQK